MEQCLSEAKPNFVTPVQNVMTSSMKSQKATDHIKPNSLVVTLFFLVALFSNDFKKLHSLSAGIQEPVAITVSGE